MLYWGRVLASDAKADVLPHLIHDIRHIGFDIEHVPGVYVEAYGLVPAPDIIANTRRRDRVLIRDYSTDRNRVAFMMVRHERDLRGITSAYTNLSQSALINGLTKDWDVIDEFHILRHCQPSQAIVLPNIRKVPSSSLNWKPPSFLILNLVTLRYSLRFGSLFGATPIPSSGR